MVGEAPGRLEDYKATPFIGNAGQYLRKTLRFVGEDWGIDPDNAYYLNAVSCWPRGTPDDTHIRQCHDNLKAQLDAIDSPHVLVCGRTALRALVPNMRLMEVVGNRMWVPIHGKLLYPVLHPSAVLRTKSSSQKSLYAKELDWFCEDIYAAGEYGVDLSYVRKCVYCLGITWDGKPTCERKAHKDKWKRDNKWKRPIPPQMSLALDA